MPRKVFFTTLLFCWLAHTTLSNAQDRRPAIVVLDQPCLAEHLAATRSEAERTANRTARARLLSPDAEVYRQGLRLSKAPLAARLRQRGIPVDGQTETVLNALVVQATEEELVWLAAQPGVKSATFAPVYSTKLDTALRLAGVPQVWATLPTGEEGAGRGIKIGIVDSGIDLSNPMFADAGFTAPAGFPKVGSGASSASVNNKVIAARNFSDESDMIDRCGHGTFVGSVAAGRRTQAPLASIAGAAPGAFLGSYKAFQFSASTNSCTAAGSRVLQAVDAAVADGMDVINFSGGGDEPANDNTSITVYHNAVSAGVVVVISAGNAGPGNRTVSSPGTLADVISVGASTNSRAFFQAVRVTAPAPVPSSVQALPSVPGSDPKFSTTIGPLPVRDVSQFDTDGLGCNGFPPGSLNGAIALIKRGNCNFTVKIANAAAAGSRAAIIYNNVSGFVNMDTAGSVIPSVSISNTGGEALAAFVRASGGAVQAQIDGAQTAQTVTPDLVADFSSRGPTLRFLIKPDLVAPGETIYAATQNANTTGEIYSPDGFAQEDGTSFSAPLVAGAAAIVKQLRPNLRPADIKSVLVNTATPLTQTQDGATISVMNSGAGKLNLPAAVAARLAADPVSVSFGLQGQGPFSSSSSIRISNLGASAETWAVAVVPRFGDPGLRVTVDQSTVTIPAGGSVTLNAAVSTTSTLRDSYEGYVNLRSQTDGQSINIPYWISFLQPAVNNGGVVNGASFQGGMAPGSIVSVFGLGLASSTPASATSLPLPTALGGTTMTIGTTAVPLFFTSGQQLNVQLPFSLNTGSVAARLSREGILSGSFFIPIVTAAPGIFTRSQDGRGPGAILNTATFVPVSATNPARRGTFVSVFCTGLGSVNNAPASGAPASSSPLSTTVQQPTATIGGQTAAISFSGLAPGFVGLYQVNVEVPAGLTVGEHPLILSVGGTASNTVTISVN